jgi:hypothetical protein
MHHITKVCARHDPTMLQPISRGVKPRMILRTKHCSDRHWLCQLIAGMSGINTITHCICWILLYDEL